MSLFLTIPNMKVRGYRYDIEWWQYQFYALGSVDCIAQSGLTVA
jgi:hypothetical protein